LSAKLVGKNLTKNTTIKKCVVCGRIINEKIKELSKISTDAAIKFKTNNFRESQWKQSADLLIYGNGGEKILELEILV
jgi:hypothetical protein